MTDALTKALSILSAQAANPIALEALVKAMERHTEGLQVSLEGNEYDGSGVASEGLVEAPIQPKHPLEDYKITEKDVGSLVWYDPERDFGDFPVYSILNEYQSKETCGHWEPVLDSVKLFFKPFYATETSVAPDDLGEHFAVLWNDGDITVYNDTESFDEWQNYNDDWEYIIGYRPLKFVNPLKAE